MRASDFARIADGRVRFTVLEKRELAAKLRELADEVERREAPYLALQEAFSTEEASRGDFTYSTLVLRFARISANAPAGTALRGGENFPLEVKADNAKS